MEREKTSKGSLISTKDKLRLALASPRQLRWLEWIIVAVIFLNLADAIFTLAWVRAGLATEANVLLKSLVEEHAVIFVVVKFALVSLGSYLLWGYRGHPLAVVGLFSVFIAYYIILLHHLRYSSLLLSRLIAS